PGEIGLNRPTGAGGVPAECFQLGVEVAVGQVRLAVRVERSVPLRPIHTVLDRAQRLVVRSRVKSGLAVRVEGTSLFELDHQIEQFKRTALEQLALQLSSTLRV